jgi:hypothetical protein
VRRGARRRSELNVARAIADKGSMARRRPTADELIEAHKHLVGFTVHFDSGSGYGEYGVVVAVEADVVNGVAILGADFANAGRRRISVIRKRTPRGLVGDRNVIRLAEGTQRGLYSWSDYDRDFEPPPEPDPDATFRLRLPAQTWQRVAKRRKRQLALMLAKTFADALQSDLVEALLDLPPSERSIRTHAEATQRGGGSDWFDIDIRIALYGFDVALAHSLHERLYLLVNSAADNDPERWTVLARTYPELRKILATSFTIEGAIGDTQLPPYGGRLILR